jgi:hypothetical protein
MTDLRRGRETSVVPGTGQGAAVGAGGMSRASRKESGGDVVGRRAGVKPGGSRGGGGKGSAMLAMRQGLVGAAAEAGGELGAGSPAIR